MPQITVGVAAVPIPNNGTDTLYGINVGATTLYYSQLPSVSVDSGTPLSPGNAVQGWPVGQPLYIVSSGGNGQFAYEANGSQIAIGAVAAALLPGGTVNVGNTVGVSGSVDTSGSTINNRPQNLPTVLSTQSVPVQNNMPLSSGIGNTVIVSTVGYSSLLIAILDGALAVTLSQTNMIKVTVLQTLGGNQVGSSQIAHYLLGGCQGYLQVPVVGDSAQITGIYINTGLGGGGGLAISMTVIGSHEVIQSDRYSSYNFNGLGTIPNGGYWELQELAAGSGYFINNKNGACKLAVTPGSTTTQIAANVCVCDFDNPSAVIVMSGTGKTAAGANATVDTILPNRPLFLSTAVFASTVAFSIQQ